MKNLSSLFCLCLAVAGAVACDDDSSAPRVPAADAAASPVKPADENNHAAGEPNALPPTSVDSEDSDSEPLATESPEQDPASQTLKLK